MILTTHQMRRLVGESTQNPESLAMVIQASDIDFEQGLEVISRAQKFIIPIPTFRDHGGGEPLVYPEDVRIGEDVRRKGEPILDWQGQSVGDSGIVFFNHTDKAWQAAANDGASVVILNLIDQEQARRIEEKIGGNPDHLSLSDLKELLDWAYRELGVGDRYNSSRQFISDKMMALEKHLTGVEHYGLHRRDDRDICSAVLLEGTGHFQGPPATPQQFEGSAVVIRQADGRGDFDYRLIQSKVFVESYSWKDGRTLTLEDIPKHGV